MSKLNKKSIKGALKALALLAFVVSVAPATVSAAYGYGVSSGYQGNFYGGYNQPNNPTPSVNSASPSYASVGSGAKTVTVVGNGFVPASVARVNGTDRYTTFIDNSHIFVQLTAGDMYLGNGFYITVWNPAPGGGFSNAVFFTLNQAVAYNPPAPVYNPAPAYYQPAPAYNPYSQPAAPIYNNAYNYSTPAPYAYTYDQQGQNPAQMNPNTPSTLVSNALYGTNSFLPSGIVQWVLFAIFVLLIVILVRRIFGARDAYHAAPLKHD